MTKTCIFQEANYARWMAACRMAAKGKSMADSGYDYEVKSIQVTKIEEKLKQKLTELKHVEYLELIQVTLYDESRNKNKHVNQFKQFKLINCWKNMKTDGQGKTSKIDSD